MVDVLAGEGKARESIRTSKTALAMVLDHVAVRPNPARDRRVKLPLEEPEEVEPPRQRRGCWLPHTFWAYLCSMRRVLAWRVGGGHDR